MTPSGLLTSLAFFLLGVAPSVPQLPEDRCFQTRGMLSEGVLCRCLESVYAVSDFLGYLSSLFRAGTELRSLYTRQALSTEPHTQSLRTHFVGKIIALWRFPGAASVN